MNRSNVASPWYREPWPWLLMLGPFVVIVAGVVTIWLAIKSNDGLVADDYYKQGLAINQQLEKDRQALEFGVQGELMRSGRDVRLFLRAKSTDLPASVTLRLAHPTRGGLDQNVVLKAEGVGFYGGSLSASIAGHWRVVLGDDSAGWRLVGDWNADSDEPLKLLAEAK